MADMTPAKPRTSCPKGWPENVTYIRRLSYSKKLNADKLQALILSKSDVSAHVQLFKNINSHLNVQITKILQKSHPAYDQHGLYANQHLLPDSFILQYLGYVHDDSDMIDASDYDLSLDRDNGIGVDATRMGNEARFINDYRGISTAPNAEFRDILVEVGNGKVEKQVGVFVLSAGKSGKRANGIGRGQEILVSYGKGFWTERRAVGE